MITKLEKSVIFSLAANIHSSIDDGDKADIDFAIKVFGDYLDSITEKEHYKDETPYKFSFDLIVTNRTEENYPK